MTAGRGVLDLSGWCPETDGAVSLDGEWEFYPGRFIPPGMTIAPDHDEQSGFIRVPGVWNDYMAGDQKLEGKGCATYRLLVLLDPDRLTPSRGQGASALAFRIRYFQSAATIYVNSREVCRIGVPGTSEEQSSPGYAPQVVGVPAAGQKMDIRIHVSNYDHDKGGLVSSLMMGTETDLRLELAQSLHYDIFLFSAILVMAFYHLGLYLVRKKETAALYFGLLCLCVALRPLVTEDEYILRIIPGIPWELLLKVEYLTFYCGVWSAMMFFHSLFPREFSGRVLRGIHWFCLIHSALVIISPVSVFSRLLSMFQGGVVLCCLYNIYVTAMAVARKREGSRIILFGFLVLALTVLNDILYNHMVINTMHMTPLGFFLFIILQAFILSLRFSRAFADVETLSIKLEATNRRLVAVDRLKDEFLANTSHELRTPLNGIAGIAESMVDGAAGRISESIRGNLLMINASARRLTTLVNDILDFSKLKSSTLELAMTSVDIRMMADVILALSAPVLGPKPVRLINGIAKDFPLVIADENRLQQILHNLVGNAVKFTHSGTVTVKARVMGRHALISVKDTGIGIPKDKQENIFEDFQQADGSIQREYEGTGLGLSISRRLVRLHNSELTVRSNAGKGVTFSFKLKISQQENRPSKVRERLPGRKAEPGPANDLPAVPGETGDRTLYNILIVDDDPVNVQVLVNYLSVEGYGIYKAFGGLEALEILGREKDIHLVILDVMMPRISGFEVCKQIRENYHASELPVIFLTAKDLVADLMAGFDAGGNDYLTKPFSKYELIVRTRLHISLANVNKDAVAGILNRRYFDSMLDIEWRRALRHASPMALIMIDIDFFKAYNDTYGHREGDACLGRVARAISRQVNRAGDFAARYGGEEFVVLLPGTKENDAAHIAEEIRACVDALSIRHGGCRAGGNLTVSLGVCSVLPEKAMSQALLVEGADQALYLAKRRGRNQVARASELK